MRLTRSDAEALGGAMGHPRMKFDAVKSVEQQDTQALEELVHRRTAKANQIRGLVVEYGIVAPVGIQKLHSTLPRWLEDAQNALTNAFRVLLAARAVLHHAKARGDEIEPSVGSQARKCRKRGTGQQACTDSQGNRAQ